MRFAYADPPYPGLAGRYYDQEEVDHRHLVSRLQEEYPDGWALSTSAKALQGVLSLCPPGVRVAIWVNGGRVTRTRRARHVYEPLIVAGGRVAPEPVVQDLCDVLAWGGRQHSHPGALVGMKPAPFCEWMFGLLGARCGDRLDDLFPGSGAVSRAWALYSSRPPGATEDARGSNDDVSPVDAVAFQSRDDRATPGQVRQIGLLGDVSRTTSATAGKTAS